MFFSSWLRTVRIRLGVIGASRGKGRTARPQAAALAIPHGGKP